MSRRQREPGSHLVESGGHRVVGKQVLDRHIDPEQFVDGVLVFGAGEPPHRPSALGSLTGEPSLPQTGRELNEEIVFLRSCRPLRFGRWHLAAGHAIVDAFPDIRGRRFIWVEGKVFEVESRLVAGAVVAGKAMAADEPRDRRRGDRGGVSIAADRCEHRTRDDRSNHTVESADTKPERSLHESSSHSRRQAGDTLQRSPSPQPATVDSNTPLKSSGSNISLSPKTPAKR